MSRDVVVFVAVGGIVLAVLTGVFLVYPYYTVWSQRMHGEAELARAESSKRILVETAKAKLDSSKLEAEAEIERSKGLAKAIEIVGEMAKKYPEYRHQHFIEGFAEALREGKISQVIYVPTEANIPILEAKKHGKE